MPTGKLEDYLPYFRHEIDEEMEGLSILIREAKIKPDTFLWHRIIENIEREYSYMNGIVRNIYEDEGFEFECTLNPDQSEFYHLVLTDKAKELLCEVHLNISVSDGEFTELYLCGKNGVSYAHVTAFDLLCDEDRNFIQELVNKKLLKRKRTVIYTEEYTLEG